MTATRALAAALFLLGTILFRPEAAATEADASQGAKPRFETNADCPQWPGITKAERDRMECGVLRVPERRDGRPTRMLELPVVRLAARAPSGLPPILFLHGGPGGGGIHSARLWLSSPLTRGQDMILVDQRGGGAAGPILCPDLVRAEDEMDHLPAALAACVATLVREGGDPAAYDPQAIAADMRDLRTTMGLERVALFANSFGTVVAQALLAEPADWLSAVVLDSALPQARMRGGMLDQTTAALGGLLDRCTSDPACAAAFPDLERRFLDRLDRMAEEGDALPGAAAPEALLSALFLTLYGPDMAQAAPFMMDQVARGNPGPFRLLADALAEAPPVSAGAHFGIRCAMSDPAQFDQTPQVPHRDPRWWTHQLRERALFMRLCAAWPHRAAPFIPRAPTVPVLVVQGVDDPITPPRSGREVAAVLADAGAEVRMMEVPGQGHGPTVTSACAAVIVASFLAAPDRAPKDARCGESGGFAFVTAAIHPTPGLALAMPFAGSVLRLGLAVVTVAAALAVVLTGARLRRLGRVGLHRAEAPSVAALVLSALYATAVALARAQAVQIHPIVGAFGLAPWVTPVLILPWIVMVLTFWAALDWARGPVVAGGSTIQTVGLALALALSAATGLIAVALGLVMLP